MLTRKQRIKRFWSHVNKKGPYPHKKARELHSEIEGTRCWIWMVHKDSKGYGRFNAGYNRSIFVHRYSYELVHGKGSLGKKCSLHKCDNPGCVRELHLFKGTKKDNALDKVAKDRCAHATGAFITPSLGEANGNSKLTDLQVRCIRSLSNLGTRKIDIAVLFSISREHVYRIVKGLNRQI